ncbi:alpha/beta hydrolase [Saccharopolyspora rosea]|uniref:Alpha/beta hydrolase n=1 Tax=Saccharopolyspora rosea TaxID=524884 RepID=A0ABW3FW59_9PSEU|nr:alpha/beta hydrolase [Saccharopolyspora rosea]
MTPATISFGSGNTRCSAWHYRGAGDELRTAAGRPCVVLGHGFGATKDSGLREFAESFAAAGMDVLAFDYRGFGDSGGLPRQTVSLAEQLADYRAATGAARQLDGVDPDRVALWGVSLSGGHVFVAGARDPRVAAVIALVPMVDGPAAGRQALRHHSAAHMARSAAVGVAGRIAALRRKNLLVPLVGRPGERAALTLPGQFDAYTAVAGPTWRNEVNAAAALEIGRYRPIRHARQVRCPLLVQIADLDQISPVRAAAKAAEAGRGEVRHYPCDHFDVLPGRPWFEQAVEHQIAFLRRKLAR